ncbi:hypothetical protein RBA41_31655, partial [Massilia sp. CCM 9210]|uniref:hypothetical protein n=1 Tax=Massilia scottii TaxID=3057166 RepID=UPI0027964D3E
SLCPNPPISGTTIDAFTRHLSGMSSSRHISIICWVHKNKNMAVTMSSNRNQNTHSPSRRTRQTPADMQLAADTPPTPCANVTRPAQYDIQGIPSDAFFFAPATRHLPILAAGRATHRQLNQETT